MPLLAAGPWGAPGLIASTMSAELLPVLKTVWLARDPIRSKLLRAAMIAWRGNHEDRHVSLATEIKAKLLADATGSGGQT